MPSGSRRAPVSESGVPRVGAGGSRQRDWHRSSVASAAEAYVQARRCDGADLDRATRDRRRLRALPEDARRWSVTVSSGRSTPELTGRRASAAAPGRRQRWLRSTWTSGPCRGMAASLRAANQRDRALADYRDSCSVLFARAPRSPLRFSAVLLMARRGPDGYAGMRASRGAGCGDTRGRPAAKRSGTGPVAQRSEQGTFNPRVLGSNPSRLTSFARRDAACARFSLACARFRAGLTATLTATSNARGG